MKPSARSIFDLFDGKRRYEVPLFQRQYVWNEEEHWEPLWEDVLRKYQQRLDGSRQTPHFLGAMVLDQRRSFGNEVPSQLVIDGQQRMTTFQIFLAVFRDVCRAHDQATYGEECERYLRNTGIMEHEEVEQYKLWPTHTDRDQFRDCVDAGSYDEIIRRHPLIRRKYQRKDDPRPPMIECYLFFWSQLTDLIGGTSEEDDSDDAVEETTIAQRVQAMHEALRNSLQVVTIELEGEDDPQVIFETLNARGEPLLPSDLLRNFVFLRARQEDRAPQQLEKLYEKYWLPLDDAFWQEKEKQGRALRPRSDLFLQHYLTFQRRNEVQISHLYGEYRDWIKTSEPFENVEQELVELARLRQCYRGLVEAERANPLGWFAHFLQVFEVSTVMPLVLGVLGRQPAENEQQAMLSILESFLVRRVVVGSTTKNYNRLFLSCLTQCHENGFTAEVLQTYLARPRGRSVNWPSDAELRKAILDRPIYGEISAGRIQYVLQELEQELRSQHSEKIEVHSYLTVEHIMPQYWEEHWPLMDGQPGVPIDERESRDIPVRQIEASNERDEVTNTLGNLTLLTQPMNSSVSNGPFAAKRTELLKNSALALNRYFQDVDAWDETTIYDRGEALANFAIKRWPRIQGGPVD